MEELNVRLEKAESQAAKGNREDELTEINRERYTTVVAGVDSEQQELESREREHVAARKDHDPASASKETVEDLTLELIGTKELLEDGAALALEQEKSNWEREVKQAEGHLQQLNEQLVLTNDLKSKLEQASASLCSLRVERASLMEAKLSQAVKDFTYTKELEEVRTNIEEATSEINHLRAAVSSLKSEVEMERTSLTTTTKRREGIASSSVSSLEAELNIMEKKVEEKTVELKTLEQAAEEAKQAKLEAQMARKELRKAKEIAEQDKAEATKMEERLNATVSEIKAAKAVEKLAYSTAKAMEESEQASDRVTLSIEEYFKLRMEADEAEELDAGRRTVEERLRAAAEKVRAWRGKHEQERRANAVSGSLSESPNLDGIGEQEAFTSETEEVLHRSSVTAPKLHKMSRSKTMDSKTDTRRKKRSFLPRASLPACGTRWQALLLIRTLTWMSIAASFLPKEHSEMAIRNATPRSLEGDMTVDEFKEWLKRFDADRDGRISREELKRAIRSIRGRFSGWKSKRGIRYSDADGNGFIDEDEFDNLVDFAQKSLGLKIVSF
ncbi:hypothetical protein B296_00009603 [Ensete ventricosum]|uniref:EF-hand domain-containing protein n=1 Tax=Ensete ventricosum TaxID=4639 RepID=A0A427ATH4_ENSVE|nr:hypothetical protein B296_00009603 [Ensete ventricosum]